MPTAGRSPPRWHWWSKSCGTVNPRHPPDGAAQLPNPQRGLLKNESFLMKQLFRLMCFAGVAVMAGCATVPDTAPTFSPAPDAPAGHATVYVYRLGAQPYTRNIKLSMAGKPVLEAPERAYTWLFVPAGTHTVLAEWPTDFLAPKKWPDASHTERFEAGKSYYLRMVGNVNMAGGGFFSSGGLMFSTQLVRRSTDDGPAELIACCRFLPPSTQHLP